MCERYEQMLDHQRRQNKKSGRVDKSELSLECDGECLIQERNRKIAEALEIEQPTLSSDLDVIYPESVIRFAQDKPQLAVYAETNMRRMILQLEESNEKRVEYKLQPMNKRERNFVHELSDIYNIYSTGRDIEPKRYLLLVADKGRSQIPPNSLVKTLRKTNPGGLRMNTVESGPYRQLPSSKKVFISGK